MNKNNATVRHHLEVHGNALEPRFTLHQMGQYQTSLEHKIRESIAIETFECNTILNGRGEWGANLVPRARFQDDLVAQNQNPARLNRTRNKPDETSPNPENQNHEQDQNLNLNALENQLKQRRKRRKVEKETRNQKPD